MQNYALASATKYLNIVNVAASQTDSHILAVSLAVIKLTKYMWEIMSYRSQSAMTYSFYFYFYHMRCFR